MEPPDIKAVAEIRERNLREHGGIGTPYGRWENGRFTPGRWDGNRFTPGAKPRVGIPLSGPR